MKRYLLNRHLIAVFLLLLTIILIFPVQVLAQVTWYDDQLLENESLFYGVGPQIAIDGSNAVAVWYQSDGTNYRIYSNYSTDGGATWQTDQLIEDNAGFAATSPQIALSGSNAVAVWIEWDGSCNRIYGNYSTDGGATWHSDQLIENNTGMNAGAPQLVLNGSNAIAVWPQSDGSYDRIYSNYSTDGGATWNSDQLIESNVGHAGYQPHLAASGSNAVAVWVQSDGSTNRIYSNHSSNGGVDWHTAQLAESNAGHTGYNPLITLDGLNAVLVWSDSSVSDSIINYNRSTNGGQTWLGNSSFQDDNTKDAHNPAISLSGSNVVVGWEQDDESTFRIYRDYSDDYGATWHSDLIISDISQYAENVRIGMSGSNIAAVWQQYDGFVYRLYSDYSTDYGATWNSDQLIEDNNGYDTYPAAIAASGSNLVTVWNQFDGHSYRIYSNYSTDGGVNWHSDQLIEDNEGLAGDASDPQIALDGSNAAAIWVQFDGITYRIYSNYSTDGGVTWSIPQLIENNTGKIGFSPQVAISSSQVVAVWAQSDGSKYRIYSNYSTDGGANWHTPQLLEDNTGFDKYYPQIALSGSNAVAVWNQVDGSNSIFSNYSSDGGATWHSDQAIEDNTGYSGNSPQVALSGSNVTAVWQQEDGSNYRIYSSYSTNGGATWQADQIIDDHPGNDAYDPQIVLSGSNTLVIWNQLEGICYRIYRDYSTDGGATWHSDLLIEDNAGYDAKEPQIGLSVSKAAAVWAQSDGSAYRIYSNYSTDGGVTWHSDQIIDNPAGFDGESPQIGISGSNAVAVWSQSDGTDSRIYSNDSEDGGATWEGSQLIENETGYSKKDAQVAISGTRAVAVWQMDDGCNEYFPIFDDSIYSNYADFEEASTPRPQGVGGEVASVNRLQLVGFWLMLVLITGAVTVLVFRRKSKSL